MAGKIRITSTAFPGGNNTTIQYNNDGYFDGAAQLFWDGATDRLGIGDNTPAKQLSITKCMEMLVCSGSGIGVLYKGADRFLHDFKATGASGNNVFIGKDAGNFTMAISGSSTHASNNVAVGAGTLQSLTTGFRNVAIGKSTLQSLTTGCVNIAIGIKTLFYNVSGTYNAAIGFEAGFSTNGNSIYRNVLIGYRTGYALLTGGNNNILIGHKAGTNVTSGEKNIVIGYDLDALVAAGDSQLSIGGAIFGNLGATKRIGIGTSTMNETLNVGGAIRLGTSALTNAGTIRWTGEDFEGYTGAAWTSLTGGGLWTDETTYYRSSNVVNSGNTGVRIYDAGYSLLGQVAPTTGNNFGGGSCIDGTVLKVNHGNVGTPTNDGKTPLWVKRYTNKDGTDWGCGAAYFGAVKTGGTNPLHTVVIDTYCQGGSIPASGGVLGSMLIHLKNDTCTAANQDIHNIQMITYTPSSNYQGQHCCFTNDVCNRYADKGWLTRYAAGWTNAFNASNESTSNYDNSVAYSMGSGSGGGKWYIGYECNSVAYDASLNKGEGIYFQTSTFDTHADCLRAEGNLDMRSGYDIALYYTNSFMLRTGRQNSYTDKMWITSAGNMALVGTLTMYNNKAINMKDSGGTGRGGLVLDGNNDWWTMSNGRYACIGADCSQSNPVLIRINGVNNCQLIRSPDVDSAGKHYVTLV